MYFKEAAPCHRGKEWKKQKTSENNMTARKIEPAGGRCCGEQAEGTGAPGRPAGSLRGTET